MPLTPDEIMELRGISNYWFDRIQTDDGMDPSEQYKLLKALYVVRIYTRIKMDGKRTKERHRG